MPRTFESLMTHLTVAGEEMSVICQNKDSHGVYTLVEWRRPDGSLFKTSELSGGTPPQYAERRVKYYSPEGELLKEIVYDLVYNADGELESEVARNA